MSARFRWRQWSFHCIQAPMWAFWGHKCAQMKKKVLCKEAMTDTLICWCFAGNGEPCEELTFTAGLSLEPFRCELLVVAVDMHIDAYIYIYSISTCIYLPEGGPMGLIRKLQKTKKNNILLSPEIVSPCFCGEWDSWSQVKGDTWFQASCALP